MGDDDNAARRPSGGRAAGWRFAGYALGYVLASAAGAGWLTAIPAAAAPAGPAAAAASSDPARAHPWIAITLMTSTIAKPKGQVTVWGTVVNPTAAPLADPSVQLWSSNLPVGTRQAMNNYLAGQPAAALDAPVPGAPAHPLPSRVPAHAAQSWSLTLDVAQVGMTRFGVYPLAAQLTSSTGAELDVARTDRKSVV